jgi:UDP-N-acetylmuramoyl-tripeptide--D-alanyl-D-alanine ligase
MMTLAEAHALVTRTLPAAVLVGDGGVELSRVHSDTRSLRAGDLFVALRGERFDGHDYLPQARAAGAVAALAERGLAEAGLPGLQVADSRAALGALAAAWRQRFELPLIAVTGSNGKTTVTQMIASILRAWHADGAFATDGNLNNDIGVPLTLLRLRQDSATWHRAGVVEIGMNHPGEIAPLAAMAAPSVALVNNAQREHLEFMADVASVARENGAVIAALGPNGVAVFPADDAYTALWRELAGARRTLTFALEAAADIVARADWRQDRWAVRLRTPEGPCEVALRVAGLHNVKNALAAAACALAAGCPLDAVRRGLEAFAPVTGRSQVQRVALAGRAVTLIDDSYNANPDSVRAAIDVLATLPGPRWLVLGDMGEVGDQGPAFHAEVGAYARQRAIESLWTVGTQSRAAARAHGAARHFDSVPALLTALVETPAAASVLVKGSRFMKMEQVVARLVAGSTVGDAHAA